MFGENLKALRKNKGITQEELAARLNIVRQTISKWEKGQSVPDAEMLVKLAEVFEVPVSHLLGSRIESDARPDALAEQLARINEQLVIKNCCHRSGTPKTATESMVKKRCRPCTGSSCFGNLVSPLRRFGRCSAAPILWLTECGGI